MTDVKRIFMAAIPVVVGLLIYHYGKSYLPNI